MTPKSKWNEYLHSMFKCAFEDFHGTDYCRAMKEKIEHDEELCRNDFTNREFVNVEVWIDAICEIHSVESEFMYERGYHDCVAMLKCMEVL